MTVSSHTARAHSFNAAAAQYAANRPSYPPALFDTIEEVAGRSLAGARVVDVGAGTGIATALLHARGADVIAVEPGDGMAAQFRRSHPGIPIVKGNGNTLPLAAACADFVTYAQAWHWTDPALAIPEALRVLRPGGALTLWWNTYALDVPWIAAQSERIGREFYDRTDRTGREADTHPAVEVNGSGARAVLADPTGRLDFARRQVRWSRRVPVDTHFANLGSHSMFLVAGEERAAAFFTEERPRLLEVFPDGIVEETYEVELLVATNP
ncbi:class I SAM-dependent methyltransferase [Streptomyces fulvoviolaceus]|uniref:class I SAM-dependent methyltransferase n=1 Tax=Streptomyces fulvoviolaceus TaxID=285535 RepID=UPI0021C18AC4|nr:class I SAM-dependent methyltransferase [Streptomyces fulvoviolaceus]MCT9082014.1 class I SAM-dependent methyltransferase [Streptomyces fulvoviolaceus]